jgi:hypothetical protein
MDDFQPEKDVNEGTEPNDAIVEGESTEPEKPAEDNGDGTAEENATGMPFFLRNAIL